MLCLSPENEILRKLEGKRQTGLTEAGASHQIGRHHREDLSRALKDSGPQQQKQVHRHLDQHEVKYLQFAFRWMNNLLMREMPLRCTVRLWDTYQSEPEGFSHFHLYVCAAFLVRWRKEILEEKDFQELLIFLQNLPTAHWGNEEVSVLLAEAYRLKFAFADAPNHYKK
ncbi:TBC1 domain family member 22A-like [Petaurus breviceps papuanus]|uniref:TBC1 domain family member 22A-like n=1 Tax=Petaurus breviceps papuanus TaxID=3040969 RepID=UPI0036DAFCF6